MFAATRVVLAAAIGATLLSSGTAAGASERSAAAGSSFVVWASGGHFAQDGPELDLAFEFDADSSPPGRVSIYVPAGFQLYPTRPVGSNVGTATLYAADYSGGSTARTAAEGEIRSTILTAQVEQAAQECSPGKHLAQWLVSLSILGQPVEVPIYLADVEAGDQAAKALRLDVCPAPFAGDGTLPISQLQLALPDLEPPTAHGSYLWRSVVTPLAPDRRTLLAGNAYELRSLVLVPHRLTLKGRYASAHTALLQGGLSALGSPRAGVRIYLVKLLRTVTLGGSTTNDGYVASTRTKQDGTFKFRVTLRRSAGFIAIAEDTSKACAGRSDAPHGCLSTTTAGVASDPVTVSVRR